MMTVTIYHNPACGTSRNTLAMIHAVGIEPMVVEYLKTPPTGDDIRKIVKATGGTLRNLIREKGTPYAELQLDDPKWTDDDLRGFIAQHPILLNRPIVVTDLGTALCRPSEKVLGLLPQGAITQFTKEDGETVKVQKKA
ncbi:MAG: arsenate reductase (glutaredoxin) [Rhizobiaceae bacterium]